MVTKLFLVISFNLVLLLNFSNQYSNAQSIQDSVFFSQDYKISTLQLSYQSEIL